VIPSHLSLLSFVTPVTVTVAPLGLQHTRSALKASLVHRLLHLDPRYRENQGTPSSPKNTRRPEQLPTRGRHCQQAEEHSRAHCSLFARSTIHANLPVRSFSCCFARLGRRTTKQSPALANILKYIGTFSPESWPGASCALALIWTIQHFMQMNNGSVVLQRYSAALESKL